MYWFISSNVCRSGSKRYSSLRFPVRPAKASDESALSRYPHRPNRLSTYLSLPHSLHLLTRPLCPDAHLVPFLPLALDRPPGERHIKRPSLPHLKRLVPQPELLERRLARVLADHGREHHVRQTRRWRGGGRVRGGSVGEGDETWALGRSPGRGGREVEAGCRAALRWDRRFLNQRRKEGGR